MSAVTSPRVTQRTAHRAWIEVDHRAIERNLAALRARGRPGQQVIAVVKANAYGHGDRAVASTLVAAGVERLAVATVGEAVRLREAGVSVPILVLYEVTSEEAPIAAEHRLELTVFTRRGVLAAAEAASDAGREIGIHLKVDSGLGRQGVETADAATMASEISGHRSLDLVGTFTHFAVPGEGEAYTETQLVRFARTLDSIRALGIDPAIVHVSGTGGILARVGDFADAIRPGLGLYGLRPAWARDVEIELEPALSVHALPLRIFDLDPGEAIGYGLRFRATRPSRIATLAIGYADGWPRQHTNNGVVLVRGMRVPIVGTISMDALTVDVTDVEGVGYEDEFVLIGRQGADEISADEVASQRRTINYEVMTALRDRLPRLSVSAGRAGRRDASLAG